MDVACFCGCRFSCAGDVCRDPACGDYAILSRVYATEEKQVRAEPKRLLSVGVAARGRQVRCAGETWPANQPQMPPQGLA